MVKYAGIILIVLLCLFTVPTLTYAAPLFDYNTDFSKEDFQNTIIMGIEKERFFVDGNEARGDKPFIQNGRTLVPLRTIGEAFGAQVDWFPKDKKVTVILKNQKIELFLGSKNMYINGVKKELDVAAQTYHDHTYLPLRAIGETLEKSVNYIEDYKLITVVDSPDWEKRYAYHQYSTIFSWAIEGRKVLYGDSNLIVYPKDDGHLYLTDWSWGGEYPLKNYNWYGSSVYGWYNTSSGDYLVFPHAQDTSTDFIYLFKGGIFKRIYSERICDIKFAHDYMYILTKGSGPDLSFDVREHSNLFKVSLQDYTEEFLGLKGYVYGCTKLVNADGSASYQRDNWEIKNDGIYIYGYYDLGTAEEKESTIGRYKVDLTSNSHEKLMQ